MTNHLSSEFEVIEKRLDSHVDRRMEDLVEAKDIDGLSTLGHLLPNGYARKQKVFEAISGLLS